MFEWNEKKRAKNLAKHGIDFVRAKQIWLGPVLEIPSEHTGHNEQRFIAIGQIEHHRIAVVYTWRGRNRRLISARKARRYEQENYENEFG